VSVSHDNLDFQTKQRLLVAAPVAARLFSAPKKQLYTSVHYAIMSTRRTSGASFFDNLRCALRCLPSADAANLSYRCAPLHRVSKSLQVRNTTPENFAHQCASREAP
jgi:hypothetical protein